MKKKKISLPNQDRLLQLQEIVDKFVARGGFEELKDSISGASLLVSSLAGHLFLWDDNLNSEEATALQAAIYLLDKMKST